MVNNSKNNTISEIDAKKDLNTLNERKNVETMKYKKHTPGHKELLNLFNDLLDIILTDKALESESQENENKNKNEKVENGNEKIKEKNENEYENENENKNENKNDERLMSSKNDIIKILTFSNEHAETVDQNEKNLMIKKLNSYLDEIIDKLKSFEDQIKSIRKIKI